MLTRRRGSDGDPYFSSVSLLLHGEGADASTTFTDSGPLALSTSAVGGNAQIDTSQFKFGAASMQFDGTDDYINYAQNDAFQFGTGDMTVEFWIRRNGNMAQWTGIMGGGISGNGSNKFDMQTNVASDNKLVTGMGSFKMVSAIPNLTWTHIALTRASNILRWFIDGTLDATSGTYSNTFNTLGSGFAIGRNEVNGGLAFNGWLDDIRLTKGVARYTAAFTAPTSPFPNNP